MDYLAWAVIASMTLLVATALLAFFEQSRFFRYVRDKHIRTWIDLGGPDAATLASQSRGHRKAYSFLMDRKYIEVRDAELDLLGNRARKMWIAVYWQMGFLCLLFVALAITQ